MADTDNHRVEVFSSDGRFLQNWGTEGTGDGQFRFPRGIAVDPSGNVYVGDQDNHRVQDLELEQTRWHVAKNDPESARKTLDKAKELIEFMDYGRRRPEVEDLEATL